MRNPRKKFLAACRERAQNKLTDEHDLKREAAGETLPLLLYLACAFAVQAPPQLYSGAGSVTPKMALTLALALVLGVFVGLVAVLLRGAMRPAA